MLDQALRNGGPHGVQYEVDAFAPRQLRRGYEISVTGHQNDLPNLPLQGEGRDVDAYSHVDPLLPYHWMDIFSRKIGETTTPLQQIIKYARIGRPRIEVGQVAQPQSNLAHLTQFLVQLPSKKRFWRTRVINALA